MNPDSDAKEVVIDPRNVNTGPMKKGPNDDALFSRPTYVAIGNPFQKAAFDLVRSENRKRQIEVGNEKPFKPIKHIRQPVNSPFPHMKDFEQVVKNFRDAEDGGNVKIGPRNILTMPPKKGRVGRSTTFEGMIPYMEDDFNRPREIATKERLHGMTLMQEKPFS